MDEDVIIKEVKKMGKGSQGMYLTKKDGYSKEDIGKLVKVLRPKEKIPHEEYIRQDIDSTCDLYLDVYHNIMMNVFFKLVGNEGYTELLNSENILLFIEMRQQAPRIKNKITKAIEKSKKEIEPKINDFECDEVLEDEEQNYIEIFDEEKGNFYVKKENEKEYQELKTRLDKVEKAEGNIDTLVEKELNTKYPDANEIIVQAVLNDFLWAEGSVEDEGGYGSKDLLDKYCKAMLDRQSTPRDNVISRDKGKSKRNFSNPNRT